MSIYNALLSYGGGIVDKAAGLIGFADNSPGTNKTYRLPPFNTIKIEIWGAGGAGGGGDHNITPTGQPGGDSNLNTFGVSAGGGGPGIGGNNSGTKTGTGGGGGVASGSYHTGIIILNNGNSGTTAVQGQPGSGGDSPNGGAGGIPGSSGSPGNAPGGGGGAGGYDNGAAPGGGKKSGGGSVLDSAGGGGGGSGAYASISFIKGQIPQRLLLNYDVGAGGSVSPAEYPGGNGANGKIKITWT
jgi:hypothetical protein